MACGMKTPEPPQRDGGTRIMCARLLLSVHSFMHGWRTQVGALSVNEIGGCRRTRKVGGLDQRELAVAVGADEDG